MTIWAIADIHASPLNASGEPEKPMEKFGPEWEDHVDRIEAAWAKHVQPDDTVIVGGDLDWSLHLEDAVPTLRRLASWKGRKLLLRGNHDYWWSSKATNRVRKLLPPTLFLIHNNAYQIEGFNVVGAKGSLVPGGMEWTEADARLLNRETERLKLSLEARDASLPSIAALHYPPFSPSAGTSPYVELLRQSDVHLCLYGHLHGASARAGPEGVYDGIAYALVAADHLKFCPTAVAADGRLLLTEEGRSKLWSGDAVRRDGSSNAPTAPSSSR